MSTSDTIPQNTTELGTPDSCSAGAPKARTEMTRIVGTPRKKAAYTIASALSGKKTGPGRLRSTASRSANGRIRHSAIRKILQLRRKALAIPGNDDLNSAQLKNCLWTSGQPGELEMTTPTTTRKTIVERSEIATV